MPLPNLLNPTQVEVRLFEQAQTRFSNTARETKGKTTYGPVVAMQCQPFIGAIDQAQLQAAGIDEGVDGYIVVREVDMASLGRPLNRGDKIVSFGIGAAKKNVEYFIVGQKLGAAYTVTQGFSLRKYFFTRRVIETPGGDI